MSYNLPLSSVNLYNYKWSFCNLFFTKRNEIENKDHFIKAKPEFRPVDLQADSMRRTYALEKRKEMLTCFIALCDKYFRMLFYINLLHNNNEIFPNIRISNELIQHELIWHNYPVSLHFVSPFMSNVNHWDI